MWLSVLQSVAEARLLGSPEDAAAKLGPYGITLDTVQCKAHRRAARAEPSLAAAALQSCHGAVRSLQAIMNGTWAHGSWNESSTLLGDMHVERAHVQVACGCGCGVSGRV